MQKSRKRALSRVNAERGGKAHDKRDGRHLQKRRKERGWQRRERKQARAEVRKRRERGSEHGAACEDRGEQQQKRERFVAAMQQRRYRRNAEAERSKPYDRLHC